MSHYRQGRATRGSATRGPSPVLSVECLLAWFIRAQAVETGVGAPTHPLSLLLLLLLCQVLVAAVLHALQILAINQRLNPLLDVRLRQDGAVQLGQNIRC